MMDLRSIFAYWESAGVFEIFLPFILVFSLVFAILEKINMFGDGKKGIHGVIALSLAILVANNVYIRELLQKFLPNVAFFMVVMLALIMLLSTMLGASKFLTGALPVIIAIVFIIWSLVADNIADLYQVPYYLGWLVDVTTQDTSIIWLVAAFLFVWFLFSRGGRKSKKKKKKEEEDEE